MSNKSPQDHYGIFVRSFIGRLEMIDGQPALSQIKHHWVKNTAGELTVKQSEALNVNTFSKASIDILSAAAVRLVNEDGAEVYNTEVVFIRKVRPLQPIAPGSIESDGREDALMAIISEVHNWAIGAPFTSDQLMDKLGRIIEITDPGYRPPPTIVPITHYTVRWSFRQWSICAVITSNQYEVWKKYSGVQIYVRDMRGYGNDQTLEFDMFQIKPIPASLAAHVSCENEEHVENLIRRAQACREDEEDHRHD